MTEVNRPPMTDQGVVDHHYRLAANQVPNQPTKELTMAEIRFGVYRYATPSVDLHMEEILWLKRCDLLGGIILDAAAGSAFQHHRLVQAGINVGDPGRPQYIASERNYDQFDNPKRQLGNNTARFLGADVTRSPFKQGVINVEFLNMVLYHLNEEQRALAYDQSEWEVHDSGVIVPSTSGKDNKKKQREKFETDLAEDLGTDLPPIMNQAWTIETADEELAWRFRDWNIYKFEQKGKFIIDNQEKLDASLASVGTTRNLLNKEIPDDEFKAALTRLGAKIRKRYEDGKPDVDTIHRAFYFITRRKLPLPPVTYLTEPTVIPTQRIVT